MALEMRKTSQWWYGRYKSHGKVHCVNLKIKIEGQRPASISQEGDGKFERSRGKAKNRFDSMLTEIKEKHQSEEYVQKLHEIRTGKRIDSISLGGLADAWDKAPRKRKGSPRYIQQAHSLFKRFVAFIKKEYGDVEVLSDVTPEMGQSFMKGERERGVSGRTCNAALILLRSAFKVLKDQANISRNPFDGIPTVDEHTTHRKPFNAEELEAILDAGKDDDLIRPVIVTGVCTAMRRGDCCTLQWGAVDLSEGFVRVKTSKTGETAEIPLLPRLRTELEVQLRKGGSKAPSPDDFAFPKAAAMYMENAQGITYRVRKIFEAAGFFNGLADEKTDDAPAKLEDVAKPELKKRVSAMLKGLTRKDGSVEKRQRMAEAFRRYVDGETLPAAASSMGVSKSTISLYLHDIEDRTGLRVISKPKKHPQEQRGEISERPADGARRVSIRDFHSFRVTWITLALSAGVPLELVQRVTGHKTTQVVLKHYFKPGRDAFKKAIEGAMPTLLSEATAPKVIDIVPKDTAEDGAMPAVEELLEKALVELGAVRSKSKRLANAAQFITEAKALVDAHMVR